MKENKGMHDKALVFPDGTGRAQHLESRYVMEIGSAKYMPSMQINLKMTTTLRNGEELHHVI